MGVRPLDSMPLLLVVFAGGRYPGNVQSRCEIAKTPCIITLCRSKMRESHGRPHSH